MAHSFNVASVKSNSFVIPKAFYPLALMVSHKLSIAFHPHGMPWPLGQIILSSLPMRCP